MTWNPRPTDGSPVCEHGYGEQHVAGRPGFVADECPGPGVSAVQPKPDEAAKIEELRRLEAAATQGEWYALRDAQVALLSSPTSEGRSLGRFGSGINAQLAVAAVNALPWLLDRLVVARTEAAQLAAARDALCVRVWNAETALAEARAEAERAEQVNADDTPSAARSAAHWCDRALDAEAELSATREALQRQTEAVWQEIDHHTEGTQFGHCRCGQHWRYAGPGLEPAGCVTRRALLAALSGPVPPKDGNE